MSTMQSGSQQEIPRERHQIAATYDLIIILEETKKPQDANSEPTVVKIHEFEVSKEALNANSYFQRVFSPGFSDTGKSEYELKEDSPAATKLWLQLFHDRLDESSYKLPTLTVWFMLQLADKYGFDPLRNDVKEWFAKWLDHNKPSRIEACREILYPCYVFDHAVGLASATKYLVYHCNSHITEKTPDDFPYHHLRLDQRFIQQLNAARGSLRGKLDKYLFTPIRELISADCKQKSIVLLALETALVETDAWPVAIEGKKKSLHTLSHLLRQLNYRDPHPSGGVCTDRNCSRNYESIVKNVIELVLEEFDGLCLDCIRISKTGDIDTDYWIHAELNVEWDERCRIIHGQPTWYFSFMGRREKMDHFWKKKKGHN